MWKETNNIVPHTPLIHLCIQQLLISYLIGLPLYRIIDDAILALLVTEMKYTTSVCYYASLSLLLSGVEESHGDIKTQKQKVYGCFTLDVHTPSQAEFETVLKLV